MTEDRIHRGVVVEKTTTGALALDLDEVPGVIDMVRARAGQVEDAMLGLRQALACDGYEPEVKAARSAAARLEGRVRALVVALDRVKPTPEPSDDDDA